ncbi:unnamed protein product, partial [Laminaria digitata]
DEQRFYLVIPGINGIMLYLGTTHYLDKIQVNRHYGLILIETGFYTL